MKRIILIAIIIAAAAQNVFSQDTDIPVPKLPATAAEYKQLSRQQRTFSLIFLGIGSGAIAIASKGNVSFNNLGGLLTIAGSSIVTSVILSAGSFRNKRKAKKLEANLSLEKTWLPGTGGFYLHSFAAGGLRLAL